MQVLERVRKGVGQDFTVGIRLCVDEKFWGGITPEESAQFAQSYGDSGYLLMYSLIPFMLSTRVGLRVT